MIYRGIHGRVPPVMFAYDVSGMKERTIAWGVCGLVSKPLCWSGAIDCMSRCRIGEKLARPDTKPVRLEKKSRQPDTELLDFTGSQALLVGDNELNHRVALELLNGSGMELEAAVNGREALKHPKESRPRYCPLILMGIQTPVVNGYEAARAIRPLSREDTKTVPILAMTIDVFVEDIENTKAAGIDGHLAESLDFK